MEASSVSTDLSEVIRNILTANTAEAVMTAINASLPKELPKAILLVASMVATRNIRDTPRGFKPQ